eukprot:TRINITY_DN32265_c0_g1_i2.p1 TRINITY_DN32265_c0_g1~~TRINITY_DN32265_c0_g1_i2.p1  ORF type:complete len:195 (-),score=28.81 TRINITY_DN32265_c0_g1_i2:81-665(-)
MSPWRLVLQTACLSQMGSAFGLGLSRRVVGAAATLALSITIFDRAANNGTLVAKMVGTDLCVPPAHIVEERMSELTEEYIDRGCSVIVALFRSSVQLSQTESLAITEERLARTFPQMVYLKTDADLIDVRALLHWEITHLPVFVVSQKNSTSVSGSKKQYKHKRWPLDGQSSPYDYDGAVAFVEKATGLPCSED